MDVERQIAYWRDGSATALRSVPTLMGGEFWSEALFWTHLAVEKALKAHVVKETRAVPPYIHNLVRLAEIAALPLAPEQIQLCKDLSLYQRLCRYEDQAIPEPDKAVAVRLVEKSEEIRRWLLDRL